MKEIIEVLGSNSQEQIQRRIVEEIVDVPVPQDDSNKDQLSHADNRIEAVEKSISELHESVMKEIESRQTQHSEVSTLITNNVAATELLKFCLTVEQIVSVPAPQIRKEIGEVMQLIPRERISDLVIEQTVDIPRPQIQERTVIVVKAHPTGLGAEPHWEGSRSREAHRTGLGADLHCGANCGRASSKDSMTDSCRDVQTKVSAVQVVLKTVRDPQAQFTDTVVDVPVVVQHQAPMTQ